MGCDFATQCKRFTTFRKKGLPSSSRVNRSMDITEAGNHGLVSLEQ